MSSVTNYDPMKTSVIVDGLIMTGFSDSSMVVVSRNEDIVSTTVGTQGDVVYSENANRSAMITLSLLETSSSLDYLRSIAKARKEVSVVISDTNKTPTEITSASRCRITKIPDNKKEKTAGSVDVTIFAPAIED
ncbi:DUF3277 family protein [Lachnospiraceae bacterium TF09-5]|nr:DUF3277 family protein [Lachnospiraceae bacterium TF09-5]